MHPALHVPTSRAQELARDNGEPYMVCEIDHQETRRLAVHPLSYADDPEFQAFDGLISVIAYPDGSID